MTTQYILAPNARWQGRDPSGNPIVGGLLYTFQNFSDIPKATYSDPAGQNPNTNPIVLDGKGEANIYWANDALYSIFLYTSTGQLVYSQDNYPTVSSSGSSNVTVNNAPDNIVRNPQFTFWDNTTNFPSYTTAANTDDYIADDWSFERNNNNATITLSQQTFTAGQSTVEGSPIYYMQYQATTVGGSETFKRFRQLYKSAQTFSGQQVGIAIWAMSPTSSTITVSLVQDFGTGGTPSAAVETVAITANLTNAWTKYTAVVTLPSIGGKTLGTNGDDTLRLMVNMPLNSVATVNFVNVQCQQTNSVPAFPYISQDQQFKRLNSQATYAWFKTGDFKFTLRGIADPGWVLCNDGTLGNPSSNANTAGWYTKALYELIWNTVSNNYAPIYNSDGTIGTRGASAEADFNANKRLALTRTIGRVLGTAGQATLITNFTADSTTSQLTITDSSSFYTGVPVTLTTTGTLPAPLATATTYYVISVDTTHIKLATSLANAIAGTAITLTTNGTGTQTISINYSNWQVGQYIGEENHTLTVNEIAPHTHEQVIDLASSIGLANLIAVSQGIAPHENIQNISSTGGGAPHNNMQPTLFLHCMIKL